MRHEEGGRARLLASLRGVPAICSVDAEGGYAARRGGVHHGGDSPPRADFAGWSFSFPSPVCILFNPAEKESRDTFLPRRIPPGPPPSWPLCIADLKPAGLLARIFSCRYCFVFRRKV